jgi:cytochrome c553
MSLSMIGGSIMRLIASGRNPAGTKSSRRTFRGAILLAILAAQNSLAANVEAGKAKVSQMCAECHRPADWSGETQVALQSLIRDVVSGKVPHSKRSIKLTDQEIADIAAFWTNGRK